MDYRKVAEGILATVGGKENIQDVTHCLTRLRLVLKNREAIDLKDIEKCEGVMGVVEQGGQVQVIIGTKVEHVYDEFCKLVDVSAISKNGNVSEGQTWYGKIFQFLSTSFTPLVPAIAGAGLLKGILTAANLIMSKKGVNITVTDTYIFLFAASQVIFYYMPIFLGISSAKALKVSPYTAGIVGGLLCYPDINAIVTNVASKSAVFGLPVIKQSWSMGEVTRVFSYTESVIPILLAVLGLYCIEKVLKKYIPSSLQVILVPGISIIVMVPLTFTIFGPIGIWIGNTLQNIYNAIMGISPILGGALIGGFWCVFVAFGAHRALVPISFNSVAVTGTQTLMAMSSPANIAQGGAALGVMLKTKNKNLKSVAASTCVTAAVAGITEPALYSCNLRLKTPMIASIISGAIGGAIIGWGGVYAESHVNGSLLTAVAYSAGGPGKFMIYIIGCAIAFFGAAAITYILGFEDDK